MSPWIVREVFSFYNDEYIAVVDMHRFQGRLCHMFIVRACQVKSSDKDHFPMIESMVPVYTVCNIVHADDTSDTERLIINTCDYVKETGDRLNITQRAHALIDVHGMDVKVMLVNMILDIVDMNLSGGVSYGLFGLTDASHITALKSQLSVVRANIVVKYNMQFAFIKDP